MFAKNESLQAKVESQQQTIDYLKRQAFEKPIADSHLEMKTTCSDTDTVIGKISQLTEKNKSLQANINSKQQSINRLTTENRKQADRINTLLATG